MNIAQKITGMVLAAMKAPIPIVHTSNLYQDLGFDSLSFIRLLMEIEEAFCVSFALLEMEKCLRLDRLIALVEAKAKGKEAAHDPAPAAQPGQPGKDRSHREGSGDSVPWID